MAASTSGDLCGAQRANQPEGVTCTQPAGWGTQHPGIGRCKRHGGATETHNKSAKIELARRECDRLGIAIEVSPTEALLHEVWETSGNVEFYRMLVQQLPTHPEDDVLEALPDGTMHYKRGESGIYGRTYHQSGIPTGEAKEHILVRLYNDERKHLVDVVASAIRLGIEQRRVDLEENRAVEVFRSVTQALTAMGIGDRFDEFRGHFANALAGRRLVSVATGETSETTDAIATAMVGDSTQ